MTPRSDLIGKKLDGKTIKATFLHVKGEQVNVQLVFEDGSAARYDMELNEMVAKALGVE